MQGFASAALQGFQLIEGARPVGAEEPGEAAVGQDLSAGLAAGAVVGFVVCVANALDLLAAARAGLAKAAVDGHLRTKCRDLLREAPLRFAPHAVRPRCQRGARGGKQPIPFVGLELVGEGDG